jgi:hypothetical protein
MPSSPAPRTRIGVLFDMICFLKNVAAVANSYLIPHPTSLAFAEPSGEVRSFLCHCSYFLSAVPWIETVACSATV